MKEKKPFYKKWWVIAIAVFMVIGFINGNINKDEREAKRVEAEQQEAKEKAEAEQKEAEEQEQADQEKEQSEKEESKEEQETIELDDFSMAEFSVEDMTAKIDGDTLHLKFYWINQSGEDKPAFTAVGYLDVTQGDEILEEVSGAYDVNKTNADMLKFNANGGTMAVNLEYDIENDENIDLLFGSIHEDATGKEEQTIELN